MEELRSEFQQEFPDAPLRSLGAPEHVTVSVVVSRQGSAGAEVLLVEHPRWGWVQPGGHLEVEDGSLAGAAVRELREEVGLVAQEEELRPVLLSRMVVRCGGLQGAHLDLCFHLAVQSTAGGVGEHVARWVGVRDALATEDRFTRAMVSAALGESQGEGGGPESGA